MPVYANPGDPSTEFPVMIDGIAFSFRPSEIGMPPDSTAVTQTMLDGSRRVWHPRPSFSGIPNSSEPRTFDIPYERLSGNDLKNMMEIEASGGLHRLTIWRSTPIVYTLQAGITRLYLPRLRKCAPHLYSGSIVEAERNVIANVANFPTLVTRNGVALDVTYAEGPSLASPGAGGIVIARQPDGSGLRTAEHTAMLLGDNPVGGEKLIVWTFLTHECSLAQPDVRMRGLTESHSYTFVEV